MVATTFCVNLRTLVKKDSSNVSATRQLVRTGSVRRRSCPGYARGGRCSSSCDVRVMQDKARNALCGLFSVLHVGVRVRVHGEPQVRVAEPRLHRLRALSDT